MSDDGGLEPGPGGRGMNGNWKWNWMGGGAPGPLLGGGGKGGRLLGGCSGGAGPIRCRHIGHVPCSSSHGTMQLSW